MARGAPPPYAGETCRNDGNGEEHDLDITRAGTYYGLCGVCRPLESERRRLRRESGQQGASLDEPDEPAAPVRHDDGMEDEIRARARRSSLKLVCQDLVKSADKLEQALEKRRVARVHASVALSEFREGLQLVGRVAQSLVNQRTEQPDRPVTNGDG